MGKTCVQQWTLYGWYEASSRSGYLEVISGPCDKVPQYELRVSGREAHVGAGGGRGAGGGGRQRPALHLVARDDAVRARRRLPPEYRGQRAAAGTPSTDVG